jgi:hypothetical protein
MSQNITDMPGIEAAMERFDTMTGSNDAADAAESVGGKTDARADTSGDGALRAREARALPPTTREPRADAQPSVGRQSALPDVTAQNSVTSSTDTPAAAASSQAGHASQTDKQRDEKGRFTAKPGENDSGGATGQSALPENGTQTTQGGKPENGGPGASRFAKAQERLEKTWEAVNKRKGDLDAQTQAIEQQRLTLERDQAQFEAIRRQAEQPQATPDQALHAAQLRRRDADALRMQAKRAEDAGRFEEAQRLNKQADKAESLADELGEYAGQLRTNPPVSMQQRQQQFEQARKQWTLEACNAFPELGKNGSRLQQVVARHLNGVAKQDPHLLVHPSLIYHVARLADAQIKANDLEAAAARVPVLEKAAESLRARIKDLEAETTPAGNGGAARLGEPAQDDYASLRQSAVELGHGRW